jgi:hypothetical protein
MEAMEWIDRTRRALEDMMDVMRRGDERLVSDIVSSVRKYLDEFHRYSQMCELVRAYAEERTPTSPKERQQLSHNLTRSLQLSAEGDRLIVQWLQSLSHWLDGRARLDRTMADTLPQAADLARKLREGKEIGLGEFEPLRDQLQEMGPGGVATLKGMLEEEALFALEQAREFRALANRYRQTEPV